MFVQAVVLFGSALDGVFGRPKTIDAVLHGKKGHHDVSNDAAGGCFGIVGVWYVRNALEEQP